MGIKKILKVLLIVFACAAVAFLILQKMALPGKAPTSPQDAQTKLPLQTSASFYPLAYLMERISGNLAIVANITPPGIEPHDFEPTSPDVAKIYGSKLFVFNGNGVDAWAEKLAPNLENYHVTVIKMSNHVESLESSSDSEEGPDPHFWLDPISMSAQTDIIANALIKIDPTNAEEYNKNRNTLKLDLAQLDTEYKNGLASCQLREIVTSHNAFTYLAKRYNFNTFHILGLSPEEDPSPKKIAEVIDLAKNKNIKYIFFETMANPKLSQTIAQEIGATTLVLNPIEGLSGEDINNGKNYLGVMRENLTNLRTAMICK